MTLSDTSRRLLVQVQRDLSPQEIGRKLVAMAKADVERRIAANEVPKQFTRFIDGRPGAPDNDASAASVVLYRFNLLAEAASICLAELQRLSPKRDGDFKASFWMQVETGRSHRVLLAKDFNARTMSADATRITIFNAMPYSRKVDTQVEGSRKLRFKVQPQLFANAAKATTKRFPSVNAWAVYSIRHPDLYRLRTGPRKGSQVQSPAVIIAPRE
ncbi:hypothetical protein [Roseomonas sp. USHLN139]|uniref:hypothetical protein n=1 Tax=Roseomonas sp. USHLN139 TaxID=3081298 RepID=UPI003B01BA79